MTRVPLFLSDSPGCYQQPRGRRGVVAFTARRTTAQQNGWLLFHRDRMCAEEQPVQPPVSLGASPQRDSECARAHTYTHARELT